MIYSEKARGVVIPKNKSSLLETKFIEKTIIY